MSDLRHRKRGAAKMLTCTLCGESWWAETYEDDLGVWGSTFTAINDEDADCPDCGGHDGSCLCGDCPKSSPVAAEAWRDFRHEIGPTAVFCGFLAVAVALLAVAGMP